MIFWLWSPIRVNPQCPVAGWLGQLCDQSIGVGRVPAELACFHDSCSHLLTNPVRNITFSNYWLRLSRIWRILQIKEGIIHRGRSPRWITPSEICRILHILRKPNSIIALLFIQNVYSFLKRIWQIFFICSIKFPQCADKCSKKNFP